MIIVCFVQNATQTDICLAHQQGDGGIGWLAWTWPHRHTTATQPHATPTCAPPVWRQCPAALRMRPRLSGRNNIEKSRPQRHVASTPTARYPVLYDPNKGRGAASCATAVLPSSRRVARLHVSFSVPPAAAFQAATPTRSIRNTEDQARERERAQTNKDGSYNKNKNNDLS